MTLPLENRRILITRSRHQASPLAERLEALGATTILIPAIEIAPPRSFAALDHAIAHLHLFDWLVFTSANAVEAFKQRSDVHVSPSPYHILTAAIGPETARAAEAIGLKVALIPQKAIAESLAEALAPQIKKNTTILLPRAATARDHLPRTLIAAGANVTIAEAYRTILPQASIAAVKALFADPAQYPHAITFTSSSTVVNLLALLEAAGRTLPSSIVLASIGPITSQSLRDHGLSAHVEATEATVQSLADTLIEPLKATKR